MIFTVNDGCCLLILSVSLLAFGLVSYSIDMISKCTAIINTIVNGIIVVLIISYMVVTYG